MRSLPPGVHPRREMPSTINVSDGAMSIIDGGAGDHHHGVHRRDHVTPGTTTAVGAPTATVRSV